MNLRRSRKWLVTILTMVLLMVPGMAAKTAQATSIAGTIAVSFETTTISSDATSVSVPVKVSGLSQDNTMDGLYLEVGFDSDKLSYSGVESGSSATGFQYFGSANAGTLAVTGFAASPSQTDGEIVKLKFTIKAKTNPLIFSIQKCEVNDKPVTINNGSLSFAESNPPINATKVLFTNANVANNQTEFTVPLMVKGLGVDNKLEGVSLKLSYNNQAVSYLDKENGTVAQGFQYFANDSGGVVSIEGFGASAITSDGSFLNLKFKILNRNDNANIKITQVQINDKDVPFENGTISLTTNTDTSKITVFFPDINVGSTEDTLVVPVSIMGLSASNTLDGLALKVAYASDKLNYQGCKAGSGGSGFSYFDNASNGVVTITGFTTSSIKTDGEIALLTFKVLKRTGEEPSIVSLTNAQVNDSDVISKNGTITLSKPEDEAAGLKSFTINSQKTTVSDPTQLTYSINLNKFATSLEVSADPINKDDLSQITKPSSFDSNGLATVTIKVQSAKQPDQIKTYTITVINKPSTTNADLKFIMVNGKNIASFDKNRTTYDLTISDSVKTLNIKAPASDDSSQVRLSGDTLNAGKAKVQIAVVATDGTVKTYTVNISSEPTEGLEVVAMNPGEGETGVAVATNIDIDFSKALNSEVVDENSVYLLDQNNTAIPAKVKLSMDKKRVSIDPINDLKENYEYTVVVTSTLVSLEDENEQLPADVQWNFKTGEKEIAPVVIPAKPTNLNGRATTSFSITWTWQDKSNNEDGFILKDENGKEIAKIDRSNTTMYVEKGLSPNTQYKRTVSAYVVDDLNNRVESEASIPKTVKSLAYKIKPPVVFARVTEITSEKIIWRWYSKGEPGALIKVYDKNLQEVGQTVQSALQFVDKIDIDKNDKEFTRNFKTVDPSMNNMESQAATVSIVNPYYGTGKSLNSPLAKVSSLRDGKVTVTIKDRSRDEQGFRIYRVNAAGTTQEMVKEVMTSDVQGINENMGVELENLDKDTTYRYVVKAYNSTGEGEASEIVAVNE